MNNIKLEIAYDGTNYYGWQRQPQQRTVQGEIEKALSTITSEKISLNGAGRTDAGVHAKCMTANFHTEKSIPAGSFLKSLNSMLPLSIRVLSAINEVDSFHARYSAKGKEYSYTLDVSKIQSPFKRLYSLHHPKKLNEKSINKCLMLITGTHNFASFETTGSRDNYSDSGRGSVRTLNKADMKTFPDTQEIIFSFTGDGFLRHMVRNIMGTILEVGNGKYDIEKFKSIINAQNRCAAGPAAPPHPLFLEKVFY